MPLEVHNMQSKEDRARAEARFKAHQHRKAHAPIATQEYRAQEEAVRNRTQRLREERLAREAAQPQPPSSKKKR